MHHPDQALGKGQFLKSQIVSMAQQHAFLGPQSAIQSTPMTGDVPDTKLTLLDGIRHLPHRLLKEE